MGTDHNDIYSIVERLRLLEEGIDKNHKSVNHLSATFKPKTVSVLTSPKDPKNPMAGKLVGGCEESEEQDEPMLEAEMAEDVLDKVKQSFADYLKNVADEIKQDTDLKDKKKGDSDLKKKDKSDRDLVTKENREVDPHEINPPEFDSEVEESSLVKSITNECGLWEVHGNERRGFEIRHGNRKLPTRFKNLHEAELALEMFNARQRKHNDNQDYIDEA
jgi:hypothetical protein